MKEFKIDANNTEDAVSQMQSFFGGLLTERWGEFTLEIDSDIAKGCIRFITFDWGVSLVDFNLIFFDDILLIEEFNNFNPIRFSYCSKGYYQHRFNDQKDYHTVDQFYSVIGAAKKGESNHLLFPKGIHIQTNNIQILRKEFLSKSSSKSISFLNNGLHDAFIDNDEQHEFLYFAPLNIKMEEYVKDIRTNKAEGIMRVLQLEGNVYQLLYLHIEQYERIVGKDALMLPTTLSNKELKTIRRYANKIMQEPSINYSLDYLSYESGLSQIKLQDGFKFLYAHTVSDYIRQIRLEASREMLNTNSLNVSQIVYKVGFTSRSYFTKIFKEKYGITPYDYRKKIVTTLNNNENE